MFVFRCGSGNLIQIILQRNKSIKYVTATAMLGKVREMCWHKGQCKLLALYKVLSSVWPRSGLWIPFKEKSNVEPVLKTSWICPQFENFHSEGNTPSNYTISHGPQGLKSSWYEIDLFSVIWFQVVNFGKTTLLIKKCIFWQPYIKCQLVKCQFKFCV